MLVDVSFIKFGVSLHFECKFVLMFFTGCASSRNMAVFFLLCSYLFINCASFQSLGKQILFHETILSQVFRTVFFFFFVCLAASFQNINFPKRQLTHHQLAHFDEKMTRH